MQWQHGVALAAALTAFAAVAHGQGAKEGPMRFLALGDSYTIGERVDSAGRWPVNNQYRGRDAEKYRAEFKSLLAQAVEFAGGKASRVIVLSIPDWGVTPFAAGRDRAKIASEIDHFNAIGLAETLAAGAHWVDVTPVSREEHAAWVGADGLHPTAAQYARWVELALDAAAAALKN